MAGAGFGSKDADGSWGFKATADGKVILGNTSDDVIQVTGSLDINGNLYVAEYIYHVGDTDTKIQFIDEQIKFTAGNVDFLRLTEDASGQNEITFNQANADVDFIIESPSEAKAVYLNAGNEVLHINHGETGFKTKIHSTNGEAITVNNSGLIINEDGHATNDFRVESDGEDEALFLDASSNTFYINKGATGFTTVIKNNNEEAIKVGAAGVIINEYGHASNDFRIESDGDANILFVDSGNDKIGIGTGTPSVLLDVSGSANADYYATTPTATDLGAGTSTTLTPDTSLHFLDASEVTLAAGKDYFEITLADGTTDGQHLQLAITTAANNPVRVVGDTGGDKAEGSVSFTGAPATGQGMSFADYGGSQSYTVNFDDTLSCGSSIQAGDYDIMTGLCPTAADSATAVYYALDGGIAAGWPFTLGSFTPGVSTTVTFSQTTAGTGGNQTISENMDNATASGFSGGTALVEGTLNSTYGVALAATAANGGLIQGAHLVWDDTTEQWQIIAGTQLTS